MSSQAHHNWYILVKIRDQEDMRSMVLEDLSQQVANTLDPEMFETSQVGMQTWTGALPCYIRPRWTRERSVNGRELKKA